MAEWRKVAVVGSEGTQCREIYGKSREAWRLFGPWVRLHSMVSKGCGSTVPVLKLLLAKARRATSFARHVDALLVTTVKLNRSCVTPATYFLDH